MLEPYTCRASVTCGSGARFEAGPGRQREPGGRHALEGDDVTREGVGREQRAQVGAAEAAVRRQALALDGQEVDHGAVAIDDADPVLGRRRDVRATVRVVAEA